MGMEYSPSDVNKDLTFKANDKDNDQTLKAKDQDKDQTYKESLRTRTNITVLSHFHVLLLINWYPHFLHFYKSGDDSNDVHS